MMRANSVVLDVKTGLVAASLILMGFQTTAIAAHQESASPPQSSSCGTSCSPQPTLLSQASTAAPIADTTVVPGVKFGPVTTKATYPDLVKIFGAQRLSDVRPPDADDTEKEVGTRVDLGPDWSFTLVWLDKTKTGLYEVIDMGPGWKMPGDLRAGMSMDEVQQKLGPFQMVGLGGPYGGVVPLRATKLEQYFGKIILQLAPIPEADKKQPVAYKAVEGERLIPSSDPNWKPLEMKVKYVVFVFPRQTQ